MTAELAADMTALDELKVLHRKAAEYPDSTMISIRALRGAFLLASRAIADLTSEVARLQAELDGMADAPVEYVTTSGLPAAMTADPAREDGTVLRCTDGDRRAYAWRAATREWEPAS